MQLCNNDNNSCNSNLTNNLIFNQQDDISDVSEDMSKEIFEYKFKDYFNLEFNGIKLPNFENIYKNKIKYLTVGALIIFGIILMAFIRYYF